MGKFPIFGVAVIDGGGGKGRPAAVGIAFFLSDGGADAGAGGGEVVEAVGVVLGMAAFEAGGLCEGVLVFGGRAVEGVEQHTLSVEEVVARGECSARGHTIVYNFYCEIAISARRLSKGEFHCCEFGRTTVRVRRVRWKWNKAKKG